MRERLVTLNLRIARQEPCIGKEALPEPGRPSIRQGRFCPTRRYTNFLFRGKGRIRPLTTRLTGMTAGVRIFRRRLSRTGYTAGPMSIVKYVWTAWHLRT